MYLYQSPPSPRKRRLGKKEKEKRKVERQDCPPTPPNCMKYDVSIIYSRVSDMLSREKLPRDGEEERKRECLDEFNVYILNSVFFFVSPETHKNRIDEVMLSPFPLWCRLWQQLFKTKKKAKKKWIDKISKLFIVPCGKEVTATTRKALRAVSYIRV